MDEFPEFTRLILKNCFGKTSSISSAVGGPLKIPCGACWNDACTMNMKHQPVSATGFGKYGESHPGEIDGSKPEKPFTNPLPDIRERLAL